MRDTDKIQHETETERDIREIRKLIMMIIKRKHFAALMLKIM